MKLTVDRHETVDGIHYTINGINSAKWEAIASSSTTFDVLLKVKNITSGDEYKLQHTTTVWDYVRRLVPFASLFVKQHFIYQNNKREETDATKLFKFGARGVRRSLYFEGDTYHLDFHSNYTSSISLENKQVAVVIEAIRVDDRNVEQYEMYYSNVMVGKEHILLLKLLFYDRMRVARRQSMSGSYTAKNHSKVFFDKLAHRAHWRPEDDETIE